MQDKGKNEAKYKWANCVRNSQHRVVVVSRQANVDRGSIINHNSILIEVE